MRNLRAVGVAGGASVLIVINVLAFVYTVFSCLCRPTGPYDFDSADAAWWTAAFGAFLAVVSVLLTVVVVTTSRWFTARWFVLPAVIFVVAVARAVYVGSNYPLTTPDQW